MQKYIHYGNSMFQPELFRPIKNEDEPWLKPVYGTGLWASPLGDDGKSEWWHFVNKNPDMLNYKNLNDSFIFTLRENSNVCRIDKASDFFDIEKFILKDRENTLQKIREAETSFIPGNVFLDFESMVKSGIDAIELDMTNNYYYLHYMLYEWDVSTILIMNKDVIVPL